MFLNQNKLISNLSLSSLSRSIEQLLGLKNEIKWSTLSFLAFLHLFGAYWCFHHAFPVKWQTLLSVVVQFVISGTGVTCGVHRLWTHRTYKAKLPLKILLLIGFSSAGQNSVYEWVRDHRLHHKHSDTEADPHNARRGFFFSHIGWLMLKKNSLVKEKGKLIDMSDIENDKLLMFEHRYSFRLSLFFCYFLPTLLCVLLWNESVRCAIAWQCFIRVLWVLHVELTVNSLAHMYGYKPYNKNIEPAQNITVATLTLGEGWHNYHHVFPYDYKASEINDPLNLSTKFINMWAKIGWAYDLKEPTPEMVKAAVSRINKNSDKSEF